MEPTADDVFRLIKRIERDVIGSEGTMTEMSAEHTLSLIEDTFLDMKKDGIVHTDIMRQLLIGTAWGLRYALGDKELEYQKEKPVEVRRGGGVYKGLGG